jgi:heme/copper-type cytochrome/quinol oxidase subunit 2
VIFILSEGFLLWCLVAYRSRPGRKATFTHGSSSVEILLAIIPSLILLYLTVASAKMWSDIRFKPPKDSLHVQVFAEQYAWNFRYAGADGVFGSADDVMSFNRLAVPLGKAVTFHISAKDVIHSFFLPEARQKQDAVPGLLSKVWVTIDHVPVWDRQEQKRILMDEKEYASAEIAASGYEFKSKVRQGKGLFFQQADSAKINLLDYFYARNSDPITTVKGGRASGEPRYVRHHFEIACAQLCGTSHYAMRGEVLVLPDGEFKRWLGEQSYDGELADKWGKIWDTFHPEYNKLL